MTTRQLSRKKKPNKRLEFDNKTKLAIYVRAGGPDCACCEKCGWKIRGRNFEIDHKIPEWLLENIAMELRGPLTADDGWLLGNEKECGCHKGKTAIEAGQRAHGVRLVEKAAGIKRGQSRPIPGSKASPWKKKMNGSVIWRTSGGPVNAEDA